MNITKTTLALGLASGLFAQTLSASGFELTIPPSSEFVDAESSVNVPLPTDEGRRIKLTLDFEPSPSNAVQVAFGRDLNGSENLEPEETELVVGCDCGEPFVRGESKSRVAIERSEIAEGLREQCNLSICSAGQSGQEANHQCSTSTSSSTQHLMFRLKQPRERWNLAKVTTHNLANTNLTVFAEFYDRGKLLFLR